MINLPVGLKMHGSRMIDFSGGNKRKPGKNSQRNKAPSASESIAKRKKAATPAMNYFTHHGEPITPF